MIKGLAKFARARFMPLKVYSGPIGKPSQVLVTAGNKSKHFSLGSASFYADQSRAYMIDARVDGAYRGFGLGGRLFKRSLIEAHKRGAKHMDGILFHQNQVKIRAKYPTKFSTIDGPVSAKKAELMAGAGIGVNATTDIGAYMQKRRIKQASAAVAIGGTGIIAAKPQDRKVTFRKIRGRIVPIRSKA